MKRQAEPAQAGQAHAVIQEVTTLFSVVSLYERYVDDASAQERCVHVGTDLPHKLRENRKSSPECTVNQVFNTRILEQEYDCTLLRSNLLSGTPNRILIEKADVTSSLVYHSPNEYYDFVKNNKSYQGDPWSEFEEAALLSIACDCYKSAGGFRVYDPKAIDTYLLYENGWKTIKKSFDGAIKKWMSIQNDATLTALPERSWQELALHVKVLGSMTWNESNRFYWYDALSKWYDYYNIDNTLFDPSMHFQTVLRDNCALLNQNYVQILNKVDSWYKSCIINNSFSEEEEIILIGANKDHWLGNVLRGGTCYSVNIKTSFARRCAASIKNQYDLTWEKAILEYPTKFSKRDFKERTAEELRDQWFWIQIRTLCKLPYGADNIVLLSKWWKLNKGGRLINARTNSLAAKADERYNFIFGNSEQTSYYDTVIIDSLIEAWDAIKAVDISNCSEIKTNDSSLLADFVCSVADPAKRRHRETRSHNLNEPILVEDATTTRNIRNKKNRPSENWTSIQEVCCFGVIKEYMNIKDSYSHLHFTWENFAKAFNLVMDIYHKRYHAAIYEDSYAKLSCSSKTLRQQFLNVFKRTQTDSTYEYRLHEQWNKKYNKDSFLISANVIASIFVDNSKLEIKYTDPLTDTIYISHEVKSIRDDKETKIDPHNSAYSIYKANEQQIKKDNKESCVVPNNITKEVIDTFTMPSRKDVVFVCLDGNVEGGKDERHDNICSVSEIEELRKKVTFTKTFI